MMKLILPAAFAALVAATGVAIAAEAEGEITSVDPDAGTITLADGTTYRLSSSVSTAGLRDDWDVKITYDMVNGQRVARDVTMLPGPYPDNAPGEDNPAAE